MMIVFIAPNPHKQKNKEGYMQRVAAIDEVFSEHEKYYSDDLSKEDLVRYLVKADLVYVHSVYKSVEILPYYEDIGYKIITDLHGVVPEEELMMGNEDAADRMRLVEANVFKYGAYFVTVTEAMQKYYAKKYKIASSKVWIKLPIFNLRKGTIKKVNSEPRDGVVYAGGAQKWQNVRLMTQTVQATKENYNFYFLTQDTDSFKELKEINKNVEVKTVAPDDVYQYYYKCIFGFILRDNSIVNKVACPTKLIEYLATGVVPIVKYPTIGDFKKMGYKYITYQEFIDNKLSNEKYLEYATANYLVVKQLKKMQLEGIEKLKKLLTIIRNEQSHTNENEILNKLKLRLQIVLLQEELNIKNEELVLVKDKADYYETELHKVVNSKKWKALATLSKPLNKITKQH